MLKISDFNFATADMPNEAIIQMSNHDKDYTQDNPQCANNGYICYDGYGLEYVIDWNNKRTYTLGEFKTLVEKHALKDDDFITSTDVDDNNTINFEGVIVVGNKTIILV